MATRSRDPSLVQAIQSFVEANFNWSAAAVVPDPTDEEVEKRLIHDSRELGNDNGGHEFTDVLTEPERKAILEYLKTL